ncbi:hypothetical protein LZ31DRAFT_559908 [Colletotrichum somersetense]|nr:hypothetical protein LZ31DRAFT_559908 [Colletotrichum somersetense]
MAINVSGTSLPCCPSPSLDLSHSLSPPPSTLTSPRAASAPSPSLTAHLSVTTLPSLLRTQYRYDTGSLDPWARNDDQFCGVPAAGR